MSLVRGLITLSQVQTEKIFATYDLPIEAAEQKVMM